MAYFLQVVSQRTCVTPDSVSEFRVSRFLGTVVYRFQFAAILYRSPYVSVSIAIGSSFYSRKPAADTLQRFLEPYFVCAVKSAIRAAPLSRAGVGLVVAMLTIVKPPFITALPR